MSLIDRASNKMSPRKRSNAPGRPIDNASSASEMLKERSKIQEGHPKPERTSRREHSNKEKDIFSGDHDDAVPPLPEQKKMSKRKPQSQSRSQVFSIDFLHG